MFYLAFLKWISVLGLLAMGVLSLLSGLGVEVPLIKFKDLEAHGVPAGAVMLVAAIALAYFWKISSTHTVETVKTVESAVEGERSTTVVTKQETTTTFAAPHQGPHDLDL